MNENNVENEMWEKHLSHHIMTRVVSDGLEKIIKQEENNSSLTFSLTVRCVVNIQPLVM